jgi:hypothetical protein
MQDRGEKLRQNLTGKTEGKKTNWKNYAWMEGY